MKTKLVMLALLCVMVLLPMHGAAGAPPPQCEAFHLTQTYPDPYAFYVAPAWYYGGTVTIVYEAENCNFFQDKKGRFVLRLNGTATVYSGEVVSGDPIDVRPFHSNETWLDPENNTGWPGNWWECSVKQAQYKWIIPGVYDYTVHARNGYWSYRQVAYTSPPQRDSGEFDACQ